MIRRAVNHQPIFSADRAHIHHKLLDLGLSQKQAVLVLYGASVLLGMMALLLTVASGFQTALILLTMGTAGFFGIRKLGYGHLHQSLASQAEIDAGKRLAKLAAATDERMLWQELKVVAEALGIFSLRLSIDCHQDGDPVTIQRMHGERREAERFQECIETSAGAATIKVEYRCGVSVSDVERDQLKQALAIATTHLFGDPSGAQALPVEGTKLVG
jgi:hypothetical protein